MVRFAPRIEALSSFMPKEVAQKFLKWLQKRKISDATTASYMSVVLKVLSAFKQIEVFHTIESYQDFKKLPKLKELGLEDILIRSFDRSAW